MSTEGTGDRGQGTGETGTANGSCSLFPVPCSLAVGDCLDVMRGWPDGCVDHCIVDPPFNISRRRGLGWAFSSHVTIEEAWDRFSRDEFFAFNLAWLQEVCRVVRPNGNVIVFGTYHNIYQLGAILQNALNRRILNSIIYLKTNAQPNITARTLTESTEQLIWAVNETPDRARKWTFNYWRAKELNGGRQMRNYWEFPVTPRSEKRYGKHPSQKPLALVERLVQLATNEGDTILDPFAGTGTLAVAAARHNRRWLLVESDPDYGDIARRRIEAEAGTNPHPQPPLPCPPRGLTGVPADL
jgi:site-specific DNA-methyltransferase (adenine-specific)